MNRLRRISLLSIPAVIAFLSVGCAGPRQEPESPIFCPKCNVVWIELPDANDPYGIDTVPGQAMACPDCENAVKHYFKTGKLEHACATCGTEYVHCTTH